MIKLPSKAKSFAGLQMYMPAIIALVGYIIMAVVILLPFEYPVYNEKDDTTYVVKYNFMHRLLTVIIMTIPVALSVYNINCLMSGSCMVWSYIVSFFVILWVSLFVLSSMIYTWSPKE